MSIPTVKRLELPMTPPAPPKTDSLCTEEGWRQEFPIDWPQDHFVARRDFTRFLMLTSLPFALVQVGLAVSNWMRRGRGTSPIKAIAKLAEVPVGGVVTFSYPNGHDPCVLVRPDENTVLAFSQKCTHLGCPVAAEMEKNRFFCPCHLGYFELTTGRPLAGPPRRPLPRITLENRAGVLYAVGVETSTV